MNSRNNHFLVVVLVIYYIKTNLMVIPSEIQRVESLSPVHIIKKWMYYFQVLLVWSNEKLNGITPSCLIWHESVLSGAYTEVLVADVFYCTFFVYCQKQKDVFESVCRIPMITSAKEEQRMIATCRKVNHIQSQSNEPLTK